MTTVNDFWGGGNCSALVLDDKDYPHIAFHCESESGVEYLCYAVRDWFTETGEAAYTEEDAG